ncbi:hypothetical protein JKY79_01120 [Candidatus Babeliales bacterium]|nr:hypothetical protein [Candidatus Babeliales bacterium]
MKKMVFMYLVFMVSMVSVKAAENTDMKMPSKEELVVVFEDVGLDYFAKKTGIIDKLANRDIPVLGVVIAMSCAKSDYFKNHVDSSMRAIIVITM